MSSISAHKRIIGAIGAFLALVFLAVTVLLVAPAAQADQIEDLQAQADEAKAQLDELTEEAAKVGDEYRAAEEARDAATDAMNEAKDQVKSCEAQISELQEELGERASAMYRSGMGSFVTVLFSADSFMELVNTWGLLNDLSQQDAANISSIKDLKEQSAEASKEYAAQEIELDKQVQIVAAKKKEVDAKVDEIQKLYDSLDEQIQALVTAAYLAQQQANGGGVSYDRVYGSGGTVYSGVAGVAQRFVGLAYIYGAEDPNRGFDCSGLVHYCYAQCGVSVPRNSEALYASAKMIIPVSQAQPGDVLYMPGHVGISLGGSSAIEAEWEATGVCYTSGKNWTCALRF